MYCIFTCRIPWFHKQNYFLGLSLLGSWSYLNFFFRDGMGPFNTQIQSFKQNIINFVLIVFNKTLNHDLNKNLQDGITSNQGKQIILEIFDFLLTQMYMYMLNMNCANVSLQDSDIHSFELKYNTKEFFITCDVRGFNFTFLTFTNNTLKESFVIDMFRNLTLH